MQASILKLTGSPAEQRLFTFYSSCMIILPLVCVVLAIFVSWWWLVGWVLGTAVSAVLGFLAPIVFVPLFFRFRPLQDERLRTRFVTLAARARVPSLQHGRRFTMAGTADAGRLHLVKGSA